jgi:hypothetical protein
MTAWLFQTIDPGRIEMIKAGHVEQWCVRRYRHEMQPSDTVFIWLGGAAPVRGIHGWGDFASVPYIDAADRAFHVDVRYKQRITPFINVDVLREHPILHTLPILRMPRATNFRLDNHQVAALADVLKMAAQA